MGSLFNRKVRILYRRNAALHIPKPEVLLWLKIKNKQIIGQKLRRLSGLANYCTSLYPDFKHRELST